MSLLLGHKLRCSQYLKEKMHNKILTFLRFLLALSFPIVSSWFGVFFTFHRNEVLLHTTKAAAAHGGFEKHREQGGNTRLANEFLTLPKIW